MQRFPPSKLSSAGSSGCGVKPWQHLVGWRNGTGDWRIVIGLPRRITRWDDRYGSHPVTCPSRPTPGKWHRGSSDPREEGKFQCVPSRPPCLSQGSPGFSCLPPQTCDRQPSPASCTTTASPSSHRWHSSLHCEPHAGCLQAEPRFSISCGLGGVRPRGALLDIALPHPRVTAAERLSHQVCVRVCVCNPHLAGSP